MLKENIAALLKKHSITQAELATELGVSAGAISNWIAGRNRPQMDTLNKICEVFGITRQEILGLYKPDNSIPEPPPKPQTPPPPPAKPKVSEQLLIPLPGEKRTTPYPSAKSIDAKTMAFIFEHLDFIKHMAANRELYNQFLKFAGAGLDFFAKKGNS